ncbi:MAG: glycosyltransferase family 4 protein [Bacillota bacterium]
MRILATADTVGGVWTFAIELASALAPHSVEIVLATMGVPMTSQQRREAEQCPNISAFESNYKLEWMDDPWEDLHRAGQWLLDLESRLHPDVVHLNGYVHASLPWRSPTVVTAHSCVLSWWKAVKGEPAPSSWNRYSQAVKQGLWNADLVVAPSQAMLASLLTHYGSLPRTRIIANARNPSLFRPWDTKQEMVLTAGRIWDQAKNIAALEAVAHRLDWPVYIAGEDQSREENQLTTPNVHRLGRLPAEEMRLWFARAAVYAHPARYESFGLAPLEAALSRCALVLGDIPSLREIWQDAAVFVPPNDIDAIEAQLKLVIADPERREALAGRAFSRALHYMPQRMAHEYLSAYRHVLQRRRAVLQAAMSPFSG